MKRFYLSIIALIFSVTLAVAQGNNTRNPCYYLTVDSASCQAVTPATPLPVGSSNSFTNITTDTNTVIKASPGTIAGIVINTAGTASSAVVYNNTTCTGAKIGTFSTTAQTSIVINAAASVGLCVTTASGGAADITVLWR